MKLTMKAYSLLRRNRLLFRLDPQCSLCLTQRAGIRNFGNGKRSSRFQRFLCVVDHQAHAVVGHRSVGAKNLPCGMIGRDGVFPLRSSPTTSILIASCRLSRTKRLALIKALITRETSWGFSLSFLFVVPSPI